jgi:hypothetical protein
MFYSLTLARDLKSAFVGAASEIKEPSSQLYIIRNHAATLKARPILPMKSNCGGLFLSMGLENAALTIATCGARYA